MKKKISLLLNRQIGSRRSSISPEFVDCSVRIDNGKTPVRCKERLVNNLKSLLLHGNEDFREQILNREEKRGIKKV
nr:ribosomal protein S19 [Stylosanthes guianensis]